MIYFIHDEESNNRIKIGYSKDIETRLRTLQTANSGKLRVLLAIEGTKQDEKDWHNRFKDARVKGGEWFEPVPELLLALFDNVKSQLEEERTLLLDITSELRRWKLPLSMVGQGMLDDPNDELAHERERCRLLQGFVDTVSDLLEDK